MPVVQWVAHVLRATFWLAFNLAIVTGLFLLSAHLGAPTGGRRAQAGLFVRGLASFWLYIAAWSWLVRGVFIRPAPPAQKGKPTGAAVARSSLGCLANLVPVPLVFIFVGRFADWAWAGISGNDTTHPARQAANLLQNRLLYAFDHTEAWIPWGVAVIVIYNAAKAFMKASGRRRSDDRPAGPGGQPEPPWRSCARREANPDAPQAGRIPGAGRYRRGRNPQRPDRRRRPRWCAWPAGAAVHPGIGS